MARSRALATRARTSALPSAGVRGSEQSGWQPGDLHMQIDAVQQGPGDTGAVASDLLHGAAAAPARVAQVTAGAGVHGRDQLETRRELGLAGGAGDMDMP